MQWLCGIIMATNTQLALAYRHMVMHFDFGRIKPLLEEWESAVADSINGEGTW